MESSIYLRIRAVRLRLITGRATFGGRSTNGVAILDTTGPAGAPYVVIASYATPVNCLTWHETALYACSTDASGGFSIGVSADGRGEFSPLLRFSDLEPIACPSNPALVQCASTPCVIGDLFDAGCVGPDAAAQPDAGSSAQTLAQVARSASGSCAFGRATRSSGDATTAFGLLLCSFAFRCRLIGASRRARSLGSRWRLQTEQEVRSTTLYGVQVLACRKRARV
jgi:hypothetical protein